MFLLSRENTFSSSSCSSGRMTMSLLRRSSTHTANSATPRSSRHRRSRSQRSLRLPPTSVLCSSLNQHVERCADHEKISRWRRSGEKLSDCEWMSSFFPPFEVKSSIWQILYQLSGSFCVSWSWQQRNMINDHWSSDGAPTILYLGLWCPYLLWPNKQHIKSHPILLTLLLFPRINRWLLMDFILA